MSDIKVDQVVTQTFYQIPQIFMARIEKKYSAEGKVKEKIKITSEYVKKLSNDAKLAYGALYNRCMLSIQSYKDGKFDFVDDTGSIFLIYTVEDMMDLLDRGKTTIHKIKKELKDAGLLREVSQGANRPNRLYLQNVDASLQEYEYYEAVVISSGRDKGKVIYTHVKTLDATGNIIFDLSSQKSSNDENGSSKNERPTNPVKSMKNGGSDSERPNSDTQGVQILNGTNTKTTKTELLNDTNRYRDESPLSDLSNSEAFQMGQHSFLTDKTILRLSLFGKEAKNLENKIFQAKRQVEKTYSSLLRNEQILGEVWATELEREIEKLIFKVKTGENEGKSIQNIAGYFYQMMVRFWKMAVLIESEQGFTNVMNQSNYAKANPNECPSLIGYYYPEKLEEQQLDHYLYQLSFQG
ncbi:Replication initiator protein A (RepA) N-terminus [Streptococcus henryi]|uniref:Replication initiator protein A (RepA) N-terminus n=1 Tax=Streptococcus henryi TaxID=439219 RepID=A0A1G6AMM6_9STRE|nr:replication initiator protein A [Streptococcus henryi]SDB09644.1 Replication initiator protein A (RepA) N-terminus [Streptococcus henryi]